MTLSLSSFTNTSSYELIDSCMDEAWDFGTRVANAVGGEDTMWGSVIAYVVTDKYYRENCL